jgi:hypothetical protein
MTTLQKDEISNSTDVPPDPPETHQLAGFWGNPVHIYTRSQALADGVLVEVSEVAEEAGFCVPVAVTRSTWADCVEWTADDSHKLPGRMGRSLDGQLRRAPWWRPCGLPVL